MQIPQPGVPQVMTMEGKFLRVVYNDEGYVILGYTSANRSVGEEWMLLSIGVTVRRGVPSFKLTRDALSVETPDGQTLPMATAVEQRSANLQALQNRARVEGGGSIYPSFPPGATAICRIGFFADLDSPAMAYDQVEIDPQHACMGQLFFRVPGGIQYGQYWLNVKFPKSLIRVPFRILTADEEEVLSRNYKDISKQVEEAFKNEK